MGCAMRGGAGYRKFYITEAAGIEKRHVEQLPPGGYTKEQIQAGYDKLADTFGFFYTLRYLEAVTPFKRTEILEWPLSAFKYELQYLAWKAHVDKKYHDIINKKK
jgi:hypothetical protein